MKPIVIQFLIKLYARINMFTTDLLLSLKSKSDYEILKNIGLTESKV